MVLQATSDDFNFGALNVLKVKVNTLLPHTPFSESLQLERIEPTFSQDQIPVKSPHRNSHSIDGIVTSLL